MEDTMNHLNGFVDAEEQIWSEQINVSRNTQQTDNCGCRVLLTLYFFFEYLQEFREEIFDKSPLNVRGTLLNSQPQKNETQLYRKDFPRIGC